VKTQDEDKSSVQLPLVNDFFIDIDRLDLYGAPGGWKKRAENVPVGLR